nr:MAG TPA: hypothetical protein [Caudoviricetes sp.]
METRCRPFEKIGFALWLCSKHPRVVRGPVHPPHPRLGVQGSLPIVARGLPPWCSLTRYGIALLNSFEPLCSVTIWRFLASIAPMPHGRLVWIFWRSQSDARKPRVSYARRLGRPCVD